MVRQMCVSSGTMRWRFGALAMAAASMSACGPWLLPAHQPPAGGPSGGLLAPSGPVRNGPDTVTVLRSGEATFLAIRELIDASRREVEAEVYEFGRADLAGALLAAQQRGVAVTVIDDPSEQASVATALELRAGGVDVVDYPVRARMIDHVKLLVVDGEVGVVGGINWGAGSAANHDFDAQVRGPVVHNLQRVFIRDLVTCGRSLAVPAPLDDPATQIAATLPGAEVRPMVLGFVAGAAHSLDLAMYTLTDATVVRAIESTAARGVGVRVLLDPSERPSDPSAASLRQHGVPVRLYRSAGEKLHAKAAIADGRSVVFGSANWTVSGFQHNHELDVLMPGSTAIATAFEAQFANDWAASA